MFGVDSGDIILDFFSGSATAAQATMQLNATDDKERRFILVQLPEETDEKSDAYKEGYKNICEIGKERIRRAAKKIAEGFLRRQRKRRNAGSAERKRAQKSIARSTRALSVKSIA